MTTPTKFFKPKVDKYIQLYSKYAEKEAKTLETSGYVSSVNITNTGFYYDDGILDQYDSNGNLYLEYPPTITFSAPEVGNDTATGTAIIDIDGSGLVGINITNNGSGYTSPPTITITTQTYDQSNGNILAGEAIIYVYPTDSNGNVSFSGTGSGYDIANPPTITISAPSSGSTATAVVSSIVDGKITAFAITSVGEGYDINNLPNVTITGGGGSGATAKVLYNLGFGAAATANLSFEPDTINKFTWRLESPIDINENAILKVVDRCYTDIPTAEVNKPLCIRMFEVGTKSVNNCVNLSKNNDDFYQGRIIDIGLANRSVPNDIQVEINPQVLDKIVLSVNHGISSQNGVDYDMEFVVIMKVSEQEPQQIEYGSLNNLNINQF